MSPQIKAAICIVLVLTHFVSFSHAGIFDRIKNAAAATAAVASKAASTCGAFVESANASIEKAEILKKAGELTTDFLNNASDLVEQISQLACTTGNCSVAFSGSLLKSLPGLAWRTFRFNPNPEGIKNGIIFPLISSLRDLRGAKETGDAVNVAQNLSKMMSLLVEVSLKAQKIAINEVAATRVNISAPALATGLVVATPANDYPTLASHILNGIISQMKLALFSKGVPLTERITMLLDYELMFLRSLREISARIGIQDLDTEVRAWRESTNQNTDTN